MDGTQIPEGYMAGPQGALIPEAKVKPQHKLEDELVRGIFGQAIALSAQLADFKADAMAQCADFRSMLAQEYGANKGGAKGNMTLRSYDGQFELELQMHQHTTFGPELQAAKALIDQCIERWSEGSSDNIRVLVNDAFQVNKQGTIDRDRVLGLRRLEIDDTQWLRAMDAISDAIRVVGAKPYLRFYQITEDGTRLPVSLNIAAL